MTKAIVSIYTKILSNTLVIGAAILTLSAFTILISASLSNASSQMLQLQNSIYGESIAANRYTEKNDLLIVLKPFVESHQIEFAGHPFLIYQAYAAYLGLEHPDWNQDQLDSAAEKVNTIDSYGKATMMDYLGVTNRQIVLNMQRFGTTIQSVDTMTSNISILQAITICLAFWLVIVDVIKRH